MSYPLAWLALHLRGRARGTLWTRAEVVEPAAAAALRLGSVMAGYEERMADIPACFCSCHAWPGVNHIVACCHPIFVDRGDEDVLTKFGTGDVIGPDDENVKKEAKDLTWTEKDQEELADENKDD